MRTSNYSHYTWLEHKSVAKVDTAILARIKKALALAGHVGTGEAEARNAMRCVGLSHLLPRIDICLQAISLRSKDGVKTYAVAQRFSSRYNRF